MHASASYACVFWYAIKFECVAVMLEYVWRFIVFLWKYNFRTARLEIPAKHVCITFSDKYIHFLFACFVIACMFGDSCVARTPEMQSNAISMF